MYICEKGTFLLHLNGKKNILFFASPAGGCEKNSETPTESSFPVLFAYAMSFQYLWVFNTIYLLSTGEKEERK